MHWLARYRRKNNLTQAELAERLGVTRVTVARWETGQEISRKFWAQVHETTGIPVSIVAGVDRADPVDLTSQP